jgi:DNA-directed RNA polymerase specialized sigma24 family protein
LASPCRLFGRRNQTALAPYKAILKQRCVRFNGNRRDLVMHDRRDLAQDAVLRAQIAIANRLIAEQSAVIARAHSAIERAMESLREPDGEGPSVC